MNPRYRATLGGVNGGTLAKETGFVMSSASGKHSEHQMPEKTEAARVIAKLLAKRRTTLNEIPHLIEHVERALSNLNNANQRQVTLESDSKAAAKAAKTAAAKTAAKVAKPRIKRAATPRVTREPITVEAEEIAPSEAEEIATSALQPELKLAEIAPAEIKPAPPTLLRRAEVIHVAPAIPPTPASIAPAAPMTRGVVQWFDTRTGRGTLRLQGQSNDLPVDAETLGSFGLTRLFKGQEIEATIEGHDESIKIAALRLLNLTPTSPVMGGMVRDRHAKQVVVELKREALSRTAARAEAEALMPTRRAR
jgi:cold shock CspA family protein